MRATVLLLALVLTLAAAPTTAASQLTLTWTDNATDEVGFGIERCQGAGCTAFVSLTTVTANVTTFVDATVTQGVTYCYRCFAIKPPLVSAFSNVACAMAPIMPPGAPSNLRVVMLLPSSASNAAFLTQIVCSGGICTATYQAGPLTLDVQQQLAPGGQGSL